MVFVQDLNPWTNTLTALPVQIYSIIFTSPISFNWVDMAEYLFLKLKKPQVFMIIIIINDADITCKYGICWVPDSTTLTALKRCKYTCTGFRLFELSTLAWVLILARNTLQLFTIIIIIIGLLEKQSWYLLRIWTPEQTPLQDNLYKFTASLNCTGSNFSTE